MSTCRSIFTLHLLGVGRGVAGRLFSLAAGRVFAFRLTLARGVAFTLGAPAFVFVRFALAGLFEFELPLVFPFAFSLVFRGRGRFGLFSLALAELELRFSLGSSGVTLSDDSPSLVSRLMSIATVCPVLTTSPGRGNWNTTVLAFVWLLGLVARTRNFRSASARIRSASNLSLPTTSGTCTSGLRRDKYTVVATPKRKTTAIAITVAILRKIDTTLATKLTGCEV